MTQTAATTKTISTTCVNTGSALGSVKLMKAKEKCCICFRRYTGTYFYAMEMSDKYYEKIDPKLSVNAWNLDSLYAEPVDEGVSCKHHFCEDCIDRMRDNAIDEADDDDYETVAVFKCPVCRCSYKVEEEYIHDYLQSLIGEARQEVSMEAICEAVEWVEGLSLM